MEAYTLTDFVQAVLILLGAAYGVARIVVWFTPTQKDNEALDKVSAWLKTIASIFGLNLNQGIRK